MTPPPAATIAGRRPAATKRRAPSSRAPSRAPGPRRPQAQRAVALPRPLVLRLPRLSLRAIPAAIPARRLLGGRGVIAVLGALLLGLVFLQVSLLKLNTAISVNVERAAQLERDSAQARATVSKLDAGRRIQDAAGQLGMVMPAAGSICFLAAQRGGPCSGGDVAQAGAGLDPAADVAPLAGAAGTTGAPGTAGVPETTGAATEQPGAAQVTPQDQAVPGAGTPAQPVTATTQTGATTAPAQQPATTPPVQTGQTAPATQPPAVAPAAQAGVTGGLAAGTGG